jgi:hypothetical protein
VRAKNRNGARLGYWRRFVAAMANKQKRKAERDRAVRGASKQLATGVIASDMPHAINPRLYYEPKYNSDRTDV